MINIPHIIDVEALSQMDMTFGNWLDDNRHLMNDLIIQAADFLIVEHEKSVTVLEIHETDNTIFTLDLESIHIIETLNQVMMNYADDEMYEKAAVVKEMIAKLQKDPLYECR